MNDINDVYNTLEGKSKTLVNAPRLDGGMTAVKWNGTEFIDTTIYDKGWYAYEDTSILGAENSSKWANARTLDNSMWVWIPRYAYKITYTDPNDKSKGGIIDIVFLKEDTNKDFNGYDVTSESYIDEKGEKGAYIVHPAFQNGRSNEFANGEWDNEITGFWMAKFEAGYEHSQNNIIVFKENQVSINNVNIGNAYDLVKELTNTDNSYGFSNNTDTHLTKNSEWEAVRIFNLQ